MKMCFKDRKNLLVILVCVLIGLTVVIYCAFDSLVPSDQSVGARVKPSLRLVVAISRHGNRSPFSTYPNFPYNPNDTKYWPFGPSQLTKQGRWKMYNLGKRIRALYNGFLDEFYSEDNYKAFSSEVEKTLMSAQLFLTGLFPPKGYQQWNDKLLWQPVPVYRNEWDHTQLREVYLCPQLQQDLHLNCLKYELNEGPNNTIFLESIKSYTGIEVKDNNTIGPISKLCDCIMSANDEGLPIPSWAQEIYPQIVLLRVKLFLLLFGSLNTAKFMEGPLFQQITELMEGKINGKEVDKQMYYFSAHDITLLGLKIILGMPFTEFIYPGSVMILELHEDLEAGKHFVEVLYIDGNSDDLELSTLNIPDCKHPCDFNSMKNLTQEFTNFTDYTTDCHIK